MFYIGNGLLVPVIHEGDMHYLKVWAGSHVFTAHGGGSP